MSANGQIILTGGAGFIGSCFLRKLNDEGIDEVIVVDNLGVAGKWRNLCGKRFLDYVHKDELLSLLEKNAFGRVRAVVHLGACSSTTETDAEYLIRNNYAYSKKLAVWARAQGIPFLYASSAATYGAGDAGYDDAEEIIPRLQPLNMYGYSKQLFDLWVLRSNLGRSVTGVKFFNIFGPNEYHKGDMRSVVCKKFEEVRQTGRMNLFKSYRPEYADGEQKRDFLYVKDAVAALFHLFTHPALTGIYNLGSGTAHSWNDLARALFAAVGKSPCIDYVAMPEQLRPAYQYFTQAKTDKIRAALGSAWQVTSLEAAVADYVGYLQRGSCF